MCAKAMIPVVLLLVLLGCVSSGVSKEEMTGVSRVGILSVTIDNIDPKTGGNAAVLSELADYGRDLVEKELSSISSWTYVNTKTIGSVPSVETVGDVKNDPAVRDKYSELDTNDERNADIMKMFKDGTKSFQELQALAVERGIANAFSEYLFARGLPNIPYPFLKTHLGDATSGDTNPLSKPLHENIAKACRDAGVDALFVVWFHTKVSKSESISVTSGNRSLGEIYCDATLALITKEGKAAIDYDVPLLDDLAPLRIAVPVYYAEFDGSNRIKVQYPDLDDPKGEIRIVYKELMQEATKRLMNKLASDLTK